MTAITLRRLQQGDRATVLEVFAGLSDRSRRLRFHGAKPRLPERDVDVLVDVGCCGREAVAAVEQDGGRTVGIARFVRDRYAPEAEIAFEVVDAVAGPRRRALGSSRRPRRSRGRRASCGSAATVARGTTAALALLRGLGEVVASRSERTALEVVAGSRDARLAPCGSSPARARGDTIHAPKGADTRPTARPRARGGLQPDRPRRRRRPCSTSTRARARWGSRRSRAARRAPSSSSPTATRARTIERNLDKLRLDGRRSCCSGRAAPRSRGEASARRRYDLVLARPALRPWHRRCERGSPPTSPSVLAAGRPARRRDVVARGARACRCAAHEPPLRLRAPHAVRARR